MTNTIIGIIAIISTNWIYVPNMVTNEFRDTNGVVTNTVITNKAIPMVTANGTTNGLAIGPAYPVPVTNYGLAAIGSTTNPPSILVGPP